MILEHATTGRVLILALELGLGLSVVHLDIMTMDVLLLGNLVLFTRAEVAWNHNNVMYSGGWLKFIIIDLLVLIAGALIMSLILIAETRGSHGWRSLIHVIHILS